MKKIKVKITSKSSNTALGWIEKLFYNLELDSEGLVEYRDFANKKCDAKDIGGCKVEGKKILEALQKLQELESSASKEISEDIEKAIYWCKNNLKDSIVIFRKDHFKVIPD